MIHSKRGWYTKIYVLIIGAWTPSVFCTYRVQTCLQWSLLPKVPSDPMRQPQPNLLRKVYDHACATSGDKWVDPIVLVSELLHLALENREEAPKHGKSSAHRKHAVQVFLFATTWQNGTRRTARVGILFLPYSISRNSTAFIKRAITKPIAPPPTVTIAAFIAQLVSNGDTFSRNPNMIIDTEWVRDLVHQN